MERRSDIFNWADKRKNEYIWCAWRQNSITVKEYIDSGINNRQP